MYYERYWSEENFKAVSQLGQIADQHGRNVTHLALAWVLSNETVTSAICGCTSMEHLEINLAASGITLSEEELRACDEVWKQLRPLRFFYGR
jgi:aryl-alcohol dehydrogenase-like predicted oxidoreductase